jgi:hypothetical protein
MLDIDHSSPPADGTNATLTLLEAEALEVVTDCCAGAVDAAAAA